MAAEATASVPFLSQEDIESRAKEVLRQQGLNTIPVDPVILANLLGMSVHNAKFADDNLVGMIAKRGDKVTLLVNASDPPYRKRFTIAHELGHHFLHLLEDGEFVDSEADLFRLPHDDQKQVAPQRRREVQANMFAAALLMPSDEVEARWDKCRSVQEMARIFNVSESALGIRIDPLGLE